MISRLPVSAVPTKQRLLDAAEELFAELGIEAVSARQIALAAGQRNQSAIRYHFGTKDELIGALLARRMAEINVRRSELFSIPGAREDVRALVAAIAVPLAERVERDAAGGAYVRFLAHLFSDRHRRDRWIERGPATELLRCIYGELRRLCPELPDSLWRERLRLMVGAVIHDLADRERERAAGSARHALLPHARYVGNLIDASVAIVTAPPTAASLVHVSPQEVARVANG